MNSGPAASVHGPLSRESASQVEASGLRPVVLRGEVRLRAHLRPPRRPPRRGAPDIVALGQRVPAGAAPPALGTPLGRQQRQGHSTDHLHYILYEVSQFCLNLHCLILTLSHSIKLCVAYDPRGSGKAAHLRVWAALDLAPLKGDAAFLSALADISVNQGNNVIEKYF